MERSGFTSLRSLLVQTFQLIGLWPSESGEGVLAEGWGWGAAGQVRLSIN